jgi:hypothetical protein
MPKSPLFATVAVVAAMLFVPTVTQAYVGKVEIHCRANLSQQAAVDPITAFGVSPSKHLHTPAGAASFSAFSTLPGMMRSSTSCDVRSDHSMFWFPTPLRRDGTPATIRAADYYLVNLNRTLTAEPPNGLRFIGGNPDCTGQFCGSLEYRCLSGGGYLAHTIPPAGACGSSGYEMYISGAAQCWNGLDYGPGLGGTDGPAGAKANFVSTYPCNGYVVPRVDLAVRVGNDGVGGYVSSDVPKGVQTTSPGSTAHFDYVFGWALNSSNQSSIGSIIGDCLDVTGYTAFQLSCIDHGGTIYKAKHDGLPDLSRPVTN